MSIVLETIDEEELFANTLNAIVEDKRAEKSAIRKQLDKDIKKFLKKGGKIQVIESQPFVPHYKHVGINREGMTEVSRTFSNESL